MNNNTIFGLAFLNYNWELNKKDIVDAHIPLICECISALDFKNINRDTIQPCLKAMYGLDAINLGAIETILKRCVSKGILKKDKGEYVPVLDMVVKNINRKDRESVAADYNRIIGNVVKFAKKEFKTDIPSQEIEDGLLLFLKEYDIDVMFFDERAYGDIAKTKEKNRIKYVIARYIIHIYSKSNKDFEKIIEIAKGHAIASLIANENISSYTGKLDSLDIYLDAPMIFNIMGINGESNLALSKELISALKTNGAKIKVFNVNNDEVTLTVSNAISLLNSGNFDIEKSSRVLRTAVRESYTASTLQLKLNQLPDLYDQYDITVENAPILEKTYQIDEEKLASIIGDIYKNGRENYYFNWRQKEQIERDAQTIGYIYQLRKAVSIQTLKQSKALLLTTNTAVAFASRNKTISNYGSNAKIAPCVTDIFLATILWANYPSPSESLNRKRLMSTCYASIELDNKLFQKFYNDVQTMHKEQAISDEQYYLLNTSNLSYRLLEQHTLNDIEEYTDRTAKEVVEDMMRSYRHSDGVLTKNIRSFSNFSAKIIFWIIWAFIFCLTLFIGVFLPKMTIINESWSWVIAITVGVVEAVVGLLQWIEKIPGKSKIISYLDNKIFNAIKTLLMRE